MANCALSGTWMGTPSAGSFSTMVITMTQHGDLVSADVTAWLKDADSDQATIQYSLTGTVKDGTFSMQSPGSTQYTFTGTCSDANNISGTMTAQLYVGSTETWQISCVRLTASYPDSITGQWEGVLQLSAFSLIQTGDSVTGVGWVQPLFYSGQFPVLVQGSVSGKTPSGFTLTLNTMNSAAAGPFHLSGIVVDHTLIGVLDAGGLLILKRKI